MWRRISPRDGTGALLDLSPEVGRETVRQNASILPGIMKKDADAAEPAIVEHLSYLQRHLVAHRVD